MVSDDKGTAGAYTASQSEDDLLNHAALASFFPATHDKKAVRIAGDEQSFRVESTPLKVGIVLSGGQAPGGL